MPEHGGELQCLATKKVEMWQQREQVQRQEQVDQSLDRQVTKNRKNKEHRCVLAVVIHKVGAMLMW